MPRRNPLLEREAAICSRLKQARETTGLSRVAFAHKVGIDSSIIGRYEHGRAPLKYAHAWKLIRCYFINPIWLASGQGGAWSRIASLIPPPDAINASNQALFSEAFDRMAPEILAIQEGAKRAPHKLSFEEIQVRGEWSFHHRIHDWLLQLREEDALDFINRLSEAGETILANYSKVDSKTIAERNSKWNQDLNPEVRRRLNADSGLTDIHVSVNLTNVKDQWPLLKKRLQQATSETGGKSRLAEYLGAKLASVSQWLTDSDNAREPGAETALRMLQWVEHQERKQK